MEMTSDRQRIVSMQKAQKSFAFGFRAGQLGKPERNRVTQTAPTREKGGSFPGNMLILSLVSSGANGPG